MSRQSFRIVIILGNCSWLYSAFFKLVVACSLKRYGKLMSDTVSSEGGPGQGSHEPITASSLDRSLYRWICWFAWFMWDFDQVVAALCQYRIDEQYASRGWTSRLNHWFWLRTQSSLISSWCWVHMVAHVRCLPLEDHNKCRLCSHLVLNYLEVWSNYIMIFLLCWDKYKVRSILKVNS